MAESCHPGRKRLASGVHSLIPLHSTSAFSELGYRVGDSSDAEDAAQRIVSLPMHPELDPQQIEYVENWILDFMQGQI